jgi:hypothetical protein
MHNTTNPPLLTRAQATEFLNEHGYPITKRYFAKLCLPGSSEAPTVKCWWGPFALYEPETLLSWAQQRCRPGNASPWAENRGLRDRTPEEQTA